MLNEEFGHEVVNATKNGLELYFNKSITGLKRYFQLIDARIAELYQSDSHLTRDLQRQECFILANNFIGPVLTHSNIFLSRYLAPTGLLLENVVHMAQASAGSTHPIEHKLKYVIVNLHDTNLSNILRFIQYFETYGYKRYVKFSSSVRFEVLKDRLITNENDENKYKVRIVFDGEEIKVPWCEGLYCKFVELKKFFRANLVFDFEHIEGYCGGNMGELFTNNLKYE